MTSEVDFFDIELAHLLDPRGDRFGGRRPQDP